MTKKYIFDNQHANRNRTQNSILLGQQNFYLMSIFNATKTMVNTVTLETPE